MATRHATMVSPASKSSGTVTAFKACPRVYPPETTTLMPQPSRARQVIPRRGVAKLSNFFRTLEPA